MLTKSLIKCVTVKIFLNLDTRGDLIYVLSLLCREVLVYFIPVHNLPFL